MTKVQVVCLLVIVGVLMADDEPHLPHHPVGPSYPTATDVAGFVATGVSYTLAFTPPFTPPS